MKAYYIHWIYPASADDQLFYSGEDDERLFHHKDNAVKAAEEYLADLQKKIGRFTELQAKAGVFYGEHSPYLSPAEEEECYELAQYFYNDAPVDYTICERDITFEDEE